MRIRPLIFAAAVSAAFLWQAPSMAEPTDPTALSGVDVVARKATPLSGLTVALSKCPEATDPPDPRIRPPKVVSSFPAKGAVVRPGIVILRVTFDKPMACPGLLDTHAPLPDHGSLANPCPAPLRAPMISRDRRTFLTVCVVRENSHYGLRLDHFISLAGHPLQPYELVFDTSASPQVVSVDEAMMEDRWLQAAAPPGA